jgi:hypothetical protein
MLPIQFIPPVQHEFYCLLPHHENTGKRKEGQKVIGEEEEDVNAKEIGIAIQETDCK